MKNINETAIANFIDTPYTRFLKKVIDVLAYNGHVSIDDINAADERRGLVWNWLNKAAKGYSVDKIIEVLKKLNLFESAYNEYTLLDEQYDDEVRAAKYQENRKIKDDLASIMLITFDELRQAILEKIPSAVWRAYDNSSIDTTEEGAKYYIGGIRYESVNGLVRLMFRSDGYVKVTLNAANAHFLYEEDQVWAYINANKELDLSAETQLTAAGIDSLAVEIQNKFVADPLIRFRKTEKVIGKQIVRGPVEVYEIWYRPTGAVFVKGIQGYDRNYLYPKTFTTKEHLMTALSQIATAKQPAKVTVAELSPEDAAKEISRPTEMSNKLVTYKADKPLSRAEALRRARKAAKTFTF